MYKVNLIKFTRHPEPKDKLLGTGSKYLEETNWWNDTYCGVCKGTGENHLGRILTRIRTEIQ